MISEELRGNAGLSVVGVRCRERVSGFESSSLWIVWLRGDGTWPRTYRSCMSTG